MYKKIISALLFVVFSSAFAYAGGVTNIKEVVNRSSKVVRVSTYENKALIENGWQNWLATPEIAANGGMWTGDIWMPWADNKEQFKSHFMKIEIIEKRPLQRVDFVRAFGVYQTGEEIRFSFAREYESRQPANSWYLGERYYDANAPKVDGEWQSGGERRIIFSDKPDGSVGFKFERYTR
ncbi:MAG: hypothetical protein H0U50_08255 [Pyrinomonadaceae bacterium]|nr:hypothetical protein [Pyrinomonadaceae bacterium]